MRYLEHKDFACHTCHRRSAESSCQAPQVVTELGAFVGYSAVRFSSELQRRTHAAPECGALRDPVHLGSWVKLQGCTQVGTGGFGKEVAIAFNHFPTGN